jgi:hypothetical protein
MIGKLMWVDVSMPGNRRGLLTNLVHLQEVRQIYREHGWFDSFDLEGCHRALLEWHNRR